MKWKKKLKEKISSESEKRCKKKKNVKSSKAERNDVSSLVFINIKIVIV